MWSLGESILGLRARAIQLLTEEAIIASLVQRKGTLSAEGAEGCASALSQAIGETRLLPGNRKRGEDPNQNFLRRQKDGIACFPPRHDRSCVRILKTFGYTSCNVT